MTILRRLLYFADPMCSWCWGFSPVLEMIRRASQGRAILRLCVGGLRAGERSPLSESTKSFIRHHWNDVEATTGQAFDYAFFDRSDFVYDTEPACRAAITVRTLNPELVFNYLTALQHAFYAQNRDITQEQELATIASHVGVNAEHFGILWRSPEIVEATLGDFAFASGLGIRGFPAVLFQDGRRLAVLTVGYRAFADLEDDLETCLVHGLPQNPV